MFTVRSVSLFKELNERFVKLLQCWKTVIRSLSSPLDTFLNHFKDFNNQTSISFRFRVCETARDVRLQWRATAPGFESAQLASVRWSSLWKLQRLALHELQRQVRGDLIRICVNGRRNVLQSQETTVSQELGQRLDALIKSRSLKSNGDMD